MFREFVSAYVVALLAAIFAQFEALKLRAPAEFQQVPGDDWLEDGKSDLRTLLQADDEDEQLRQRLEDEPLAHAQRVVWVRAYPRSGSSTVLSMVQAAGPAVGSVQVKNPLDVRTFALFEPCHDGDEYEDWLEQAGCPTVLERITQCNFDGVQKLWGWRDPHSTNGGDKNFSHESAAGLCRSSEVVSFKTVDWGHRLQDWMWLLDKTPDMRVVDIVRDPRGIFASWKTTEPFASLIKSGDYYTLSDICEAYAENLAVSQSKVHHLIFENFVKNPKQIMLETYDFLGLHFGTYQDQWLNDTFDAKDCPPPPKWEEGFTDCHMDSEAETDKWREVLTSEELEAFNNNDACQHIIKAYGYPEK